MARAAVLAARSGAVTRQLCEASISCLAAVLAASMVFSFWISALRSFSVFSNPLFSSAIWRTLSGKMKGSLRSLRCGQLWNQECLLSSTMTCGVSSASRSATLIDSWSRLE